MFYLLKYFINWDVTFRVCLKFKMDKREQILVYSRGERK